MTTNVNGEYVDRDEILPLLGQTRVDGKWLMSYCPVHADGTKHGQRGGGESLGLSSDGVLQCFAGCDFRDVIAALRERGPRAMVTHLPDQRRRREGGGAGATNLVSIYDYRDADGVLVAQKGRFEGDGRKSFLWRMPGADSWKGLDGIGMRDMPLFGAHFLKEHPSDVVYFIEGEKATEAAWEQGLVAVCAGGGAAQQDFGASLEVLRGRRVFLWPDNDPPGRRLMNLLEAFLSAICLDVGYVAVPNVQREKDDAFDYFARGGTVDNLELTSPREPVVEWISDDALRAKVPTEYGDVVVLSEEISRDGRDFDTKLTISAPTLVRPYRQRLNLLSSSAKTEMRRELDAIAGKQFNWTAVLHDALALIQGAFEEHSEAIAIGDIPTLAITTRYLLNPLIIDGPTIIFGDGSAFKSYISTWLCLLYALGVQSAGVSPELTGRILYVDYEDSGTTFKGRLTRLGAAIGLGPELVDMLDIHYFDPHGVPLKDLVDTLRREVQRHGITWAIIDTAGPACGGEPEDAATAIAYFRALKRIGIPTLTLAHITKGGDDQKPFGSVFWHNEARRTWYIARQQEDDSDEIDLMLFCRKVNQGRRPSPLQLHVSFDGLEGPTTISRGDTNVIALTDWRPLSLVDQIRGAIQQDNGRPLTVAEIHRIIVDNGGNASAQVVRSTISRRRNMFVAVETKQAGRGRPESRWGLAVQKSLVEQTPIDTEFAAAAAGPAPAADDSSWHGK